MLNTLITSKTRINLLLKFFLNPGTKAYLRELAAEFGESTNAIRVELKRLSNAKLLQSTNMREDGASIFGYHVKDPERYGIVEFDQQGHVISLEEKPEKPKSNYAVTGLYFYDSKAVEYAKQIKPSYRGELEITDLNRMYLEEQTLSVELMGRGYAWLDTGTHESLLEANQFIQTIEHRQGLKISCPEEIAFQSGWISAEQLLDLAQPMAKNNYGKYLMQLLK